MLPLYDANFDKRKAKKTKRNLVGVFLLVSGFILLIGNFLFIVDYSVSSEEVVELKERVEAKKGELTATEQASEEAKKREALQKIATDFCELAESLKVADIKTTVEYYETIEPIFKTVIKQECPVSAAFLEGWNAKKATLLSAIKDVKCTPSYSNIYMNWEAVITNTLNHPVNINVNLIGKDGDLVVDDSFLIVNNLKAGESRVIKTILSTNNRNINSCEISDLVWYTGS